MPKARYSTLISETGLRPTVWSNYNLHSNEGRPCGCLVAVLMMMPVVCVCV